jgi:tetratricopeptide (TPR) repeat protein
MNAEPVTYAWGMAEAALGDRNYRQFKRWEKEIETVNLDFVLRPPWFIALPLPAQKLAVIQEDLKRDVPAESLDQRALRFLTIMVGRATVSTTTGDETIEPYPEKRTEMTNPGAGSPARDLDTSIRNYQFAECVGRVRDLPGPLKSDARILSQLAECQWKIGAFEKSWATSLKARRANPRLEKDLYWEIESLLEISKYGFSRLSHLPSGQGHVHELLAKAYEAREQDGKAVEEYKLALQLSPESVEIRLSLAALQMRSLHYEEAIESFRDALKYSANDRDAHYGLGVAYVQLHQPQAATEHLQKALQLSPNWAEAHASLAQAYRQLDQYREAAAEFEKATTSDRDGSIHLQLYQMYKKVGEEQKARQALEKSIALRQQSRISHEKAIRQQLDLTKSE